MIHLLRSRATGQQLDEMLESLGLYVKLAVDIRRGVLAGGGALHADCEAVLQILALSVRDRVAQTTRRLLEGV